jgi:hypothetical protein
VFCIIIELDPYTVIYASCRTVFLMCLGFSSFLLVLKCVNNVYILASTFEFIDFYAYMVKLFMKVLKFLIFLLNGGKIFAPIN